VKAANFERPGLEFLKLIDVEEPKISDHDVLIRVKVAQSIIVLCQVE